MDGKRRWLIKTLMGRNGINKTGLWNVEKVGVQNDSQVPRLGN